MPLEPMGHMALSLPYYVIYLTNRLFSWLTCDLYVKLIVDRATVTRFT